MKDVKAKYFKQGHWDKEGVKDYLALPCFNSASTIDAMEVTTPTSGIQSKVTLRWYGWLHHRHHR